MLWVYDGKTLEEPYDTPQWFYFGRIADDGGTTEEYEEWLEAAIKSKRLRMVKGD